MPGPQMESFEEAFVRLAPIGEPDACWEWPLTRRTVKGYGDLCVGFGPRRRRTGAHRYAWERAYGPIPPGLKVLHVVCDNPPCVNVAHLQLGTQRDNIHDAMAKGRHTKPPVAKPGHRGNAGTTNGRARLTEAQVLTIRARYAAGDVTQAELGAEFGVVQAQISEIVLRKTWRHI